MLALLAFMRKPRLTRRDDGFTILELLVVMVVIAILAAIAVPLFLNQSRSAVDASVKSDVRNTVTNVFNWLRNHPGEAVANTSEFVAKNGQPAASRPGTKISVQITANSDYVVCAYDAAGNDYRQPSDAWAFNSVKGDFGTIDKVIGAGATCSAETVNNGGAGTGDASPDAPKWSTAAVLPTADLNEDYSRTLVATGQPNPTYSVNASTPLPDGLTLNGSSGKLSGTPTTSGSYSFTVTAKNDSGAAARNFTLRVGPVSTVPQWNTSASLKDAKVGAAYSMNFDAVGNPTPYYQLEAGSSFPAGLSLDSTSGKVSGTPTSAATSTFTVIAKNFKGSASRTFTLRVQDSSATVPGDDDPDPDPDGGTGPVVGGGTTTPSAGNVAPEWTTAASLKDGTQNSAYSADVSASGVPTPTYSIASNSDLPTGLKLNATSGGISGTPTVYGSFSFDIIARNSVGSSIRTFTLTLGREHTAPAFSTSAALNAGEQNNAYSADLNATGYPAPTYALVNNSTLPAGLKLNSNSGTISGTPTDYGNYSFSIAASNSEDSSTRIFTLSILSERVVPTFTTQQSLSNGEQGEAYEAQLNATGNPEPTYALDSGSTLPGGLNLNSKTGLISGTPTVSGPFNFSVVASNSKGSTTRAFSVIFAQQRVAPSWITSVNLPSAEQASAYSTTVSASAVPDATYKLNGTLPAGLAFDAATARISGTPTSFGTFSFEIAATNSKGSAARTFVLEVGKQRVAPAFTTDVALADGEQGTAYSQQLTATGFPAASFTLASGSSLPAGLNLNSTSGVISGTPDLYGTFVFTVTAANSKGSVDRTFFLNLAQQRVAPAFTSSANLPDGEQTIAYSTSVSASGVPAPTFALATGSTLPTGLSLNTTSGAISGTPTAFGTFSFAIVASNSKGSDSRTFTVVLAKQRVAPAFTTAANLAAGEQGEAYAGSIVASGEPAPSYTLKSGSTLPDGLSLNSAGALSGTPTVFGSFSFTVTASNSKGDAERTFTVTIAKARVAPAFTTDPTLPAGEQTIAYTTSVSADGEPASTYAVKSGSTLPAGLTLSTSGTISGTPTAFGAFAFTLTATNSKGVAERTFTVSIAKQRVAPAFTTAANLAAGEQGEAYATNVVASGEPAPSYTITTGTLPDGLTLSTSGAISGTPTVFGSFSFEVTATNSKGAAARTFTLQLAQHRVAPAFTGSAALVDGEQTIAYSATLSASGVPAPAFALASGSTLPAGLSLSAAGAISGTPTVFGSFSFEVTATNSKGAVTRTYTLALAKQRVAPAFTTGVSLADGEQGEAYSGLITATGEPTPSYALASGSSLPDGLSFNTTTAAISGTPTVYGNFIFTVTATNSKGSADRTFFLYLAQHRVAPTFTTGANLPDGEQTIAYSATIAASGVPAPTYAVTSGTLPAGLTLSSAGVLSGTPTVYGNFSFTITATNSKGSADRVFSLSLAKQRVAPAFTTAAALPAAEQNSGYSAALVASGEPAPTYALASGSALPDGLTLGNTGVLSGTPTLFGSFSFDVVATNSKGAATRTFTLAIAKQRVAPAFTSSATLPDGERTIAYSTTVTATGEPAPSYSVASGSNLPAGLTLSSGGVLSGTPSVDGAFTFTLTATNSKASANQVFTLNIAKQRVTPAFTTNVSLADGEQGEVYGSVVAATGEPAPSYSVASGSTLPDGLSLNATSGVLSGTPTVYGNFVFTLNATNSKGSDSRTFFLYLAQHRVAPAFNTAAALPAAEQTIAYSTTLSASGVPTPAFTLASGSTLPAGLSLSTSGTISGTPTSFGAFAFTVTAANSKGVDNRGFTLNIAKQRVTPTFTTAAALADGEQGAAYSAVITATGEPAPTYSVTSGSTLPAGLSLNGTSGVLSGTPTTPGSYSFTLTATNSKGSIDRAFTLVIAPARVGPAFTTGASLPAGEQNSAYSTTISASGVPNPTYALASGSTLPTGLALNTTSGVLSGTPTAFGDFSFTITASNSKSSIDRVFTVSLAKQRVAPFFTTTATLPSGEQGTAYSATIAATGEPVPTYAVTSGTLPAGLALNSTTGAISGTPTDFGSTTFTVTASNSKGSADRAFTVTFAKTRVAPAFTGSATLPAGEQSTAYTTTLAASGEPAPAFSVTSGSALPAGLMLDNVNGTISGTPTVFGSFSFTITAANSKGSVDRAYTLTLAKQRVAPTFTSSATLANAEVASAYSTTIAASGEPAPTFALASGSTLPSGLSFDGTSGILSGTPTADGTFSFSIVASNSKDSTTRAYSLVIAKQRVLPAFTTSAALTAGEQGTAYSTTIAATGEPAPTFAVTSGSTLPTGLTLSSAGVLSGTPTVNGSFSFTITATNSKGSVDRTFSLTLAQTRVTPAFTTAAALPDGVQNNAYSTTIAASGVPTPTYAVTAGTLPAGLSLSAAGVLSGTPTDYAAYSFDVTASNSKGSAVRTFTLTIARQPVAPSFNTTSVSSAVVSDAYSQTMSTNGYPSPTFSIVSGSLPTGLSLSTSTGTISGTPTVAGTYNFTLRATNATGTADRAFTLQVNERPSVQNANLASGQLDQSYSQTINTLGTPAPTVTVTGLPAGLSYNSTSATITGTPTASGSFSVRVSVSNTAGSSYRDYTMVIAGRAATPTNVRATRLFGNQISYAWDASAGASSYNVTVSGATTDGSTSSFNTTNTSASGVIGIGEYGNALNVSVVAVRSGYANSTPGTGSISTPGRRLNNGALYACPGSYYDQNTIVNANCALTSFDGTWTAIMQGDGNFVVYKNDLSSGAVKYFFATNRGGAGNYLSAQTDSNLVVYNSANGAVIATNTYTSGNVGSNLAMGNAGDLKLRRNDNGAEIWNNIGPNSYTNTRFVDWVAGSNVSMTNAGAEVDDYGNTQWSTYYGPSSGFTTEDKHDGNRSYKITTTGNNVEGFIIGTNFSAPKGEREFVTLWVKGTAGETWSIAGRTNAYAEGMGAYNFTTDGSWQLVNVLYTVPVDSVGQVFIQMRQAYSGSAGKVLYADSMSVYRGYPG